MITFTSVTPVLPMKIHVEGDMWFYVLAIQTVFDDAMNDDENQVTTYATPFGSVYTNDTLKTCVFINGEWVDIDEF